MRARIILTAYQHPEQSNQQIASASGTTDRTVRKWRGRWVASHHEVSLGQEMKEGPLPSANFPVDL